MAKTITIANAHSQYKPTQSFQLQLEIGDTWYGYLWVNDVMFRVKLLEVDSEKNPGTLKEIVYIELEDDDPE